MSLTHRSRIALVSLTIAYEHRQCHDVTDGRACTPLGGTLILRVIIWAHYLGPPGPSTSQILGTFSRFLETVLAERETLGRIP